MISYVVGGTLILLAVLTQLYTAVAAGDREFELEDEEQEKYIMQWRLKHQPKS